MLNKNLVEYSENTPNLPLDVKQGLTYVIEQHNPNYATHGYFKYPCKFIPELPRWAINKYLDKEGGRVYDPFAGSGTTLLEGILNNCDTYGTEIDDIAKLVIRAKTTPLSVNEIEEMNAIIKDILLRLSCYTTEQRYSLAKINNLYHWFTEENARKLGIIRYYIDEEISNPRIKDFVSLCFITIIRAVSNADDVSPKPYVSRRVIKKPADPAEEFERIYKRYINGLIELNSYKIRTATLVKGDALRVDLSLEVDLIITSPPYINAFDYARTLRLENLWLGLETEESLRDKKKLYVGTEQIRTREEGKDLRILEESRMLESYYNRIKQVDVKRALIVKKFFDDMRKNLMEMKKILVNNGRYCIVIGNNNIRSVEIESWKVLCEIAQKVGYEVDLYFSYEIQNPYLRIPRKGLGGKIDKDNVIVLRNKG